MHKVILIFLVHFFGVISFSQELTIWKFLAIWALCSVKIFKFDPSNPFYNIINTRNCDFKGKRKTVFQILLFIHMFIHNRPWYKSFWPKKWKKPLLAYSAQKEHQNNLQSKIDLFEFNKVHILNNGFRFHNWTMANFQILYKCYHDQSNRVNAL